MRALVSHAVFTLLTSICVGGHFYCSTTMADTVASLIASLLLEPRITNTGHVKSRHLLQLMAIHCHEYITTPSSTLPSDSELGYDLCQFEGLHSFVMLHVAVTLGPVLDPRFYRSWSEKKADQSECLMIAHARGAALVTMERLSATGRLRIVTESRPKGMSLMEYFNNMLLETAILYFHAFTYVSGLGKETITHHKVEDRPRVKKLLRQALSHNAGLLARFDEDIVANPPLKRPRSLLSVPLPDKTARVIEDNRMRPGGSSRKPHDPYALIQRGLTWELKKTVQGFHDNNIAKKEEK